MERSPALKFENIIREAHEVREEALESASKEGKIVLFMRNPNEQEPRITILADNHEASAVFLARAVHISRLRVSQMNIPSTPMEIMIYDSFEEKSATARIEQICRYLPGFIRELCPQTSNLPIEIYRSNQDFHAKNPIAILQLERGVITAKLDTSKLEDLDNPQLAS